MKNFLLLSIAALASTTLGTITVVSPAKATDFGQQEVDQNKFIAIAVPHVGSSPHLVILEQISNTQSCWKESGTSPITIEALLLNFDFTGICGRSTDTNGYSIRMAGEDMCLLYKIKLVQNNSEFVLVGISNTDPHAPTVEIGRSHGIGSGLTKIDLEPGWRFTKRTYNGQPLGHIYLTNDLTAPNIHSTTVKNQ
jgi:N-acetylmuramoyl-L-alanine amidase